LSGQKCIRYCCQLVEIYQTVVWDAKFRTQTGGVPLYHDVTAHGPRIDITCIPGFVTSTLGCTRCACATVHACGKHVAIKNYGVKFTILFWQTRIVVLSNFNRGCEYVFEMYL